MTLITPSDPAKKAKATGYYLLPAALRNFVRSRETGLVSVAIVIGLLSGLLVAAISKLSEVAHALLFDIPSTLILVPPASLPGNAHCSFPSLAALFWLRSGCFSRAVSRTATGRRDRGQRTLRRARFVSRQHADFDADLAVKRLWWIGGARGRVHSNLLRVRLAYWPAGWRHAAATCGCSWLTVRREPSARPSRRHFRKCPDPMQGSWTIISGG